MVESKPKDLGKIDPTSIENLQPAAIRALLRIEWCREDGRPLSEGDHFILEYADPETLRGFLIAVYSRKEKSAEN